jgi:hypothetical protein
VRYEDVSLANDSIANCIAPPDAGSGARWAIWGYTASGDLALGRQQGVGDLALGREQGVPVLTVDELRALTDGGGSPQARAPA